jgi:hypothetical protein
MEPISKDEIIESWIKETDPTRRDELIKIMIARKIFPDKETAQVENDGALFPDIEDPMFIQKIMGKREFAESKQRSLADLLEEEQDFCGSNKEFELSPVQRFISRFLSPATPYNSALLYHGVGVGKTCAAISTAEAFLEKYPKKPVIILAPPNIQPNFSRTIFDITSVKFGTGDEANTMTGCTGNLYLQLANCEYVRDEALVKSRVARVISKRYEMYGYYQFYLYVASLLSKIPKEIPAERRVQVEYDILRRNFSGRMIIIDEAHNLRDVGETEADNLDVAGGAQELSDSEAGKKLTPVLRDLLDRAEGTKLLLLTATPMYNSIREIVFLFNLLLRNDKRAIISEKMPGAVGSIFTKDGALTEEGRFLIGNAASAYMSFMRGENPLAFPVRLDPESQNRLSTYPTHAPNGSSLNPTEGERVLRLPLVKVQFPASSIRTYREISSQGIEQGGMSVSSVDLLVQAGNFMFPGEGTLARVREAGFKAVFQDSVEQSQKTFKSKIGPPTWLLEENIGEYSPKAAYILSRVRRSQGVVFVYSRFVASGALSLALALEANGYTLEGRDSALLKDGIQSPKGRQCAMCPLKEREHAAATHKFVPAKYVILTGQTDYTPRNKYSMDLARSKENAYGGIVKVVIGSQVASEGIDLRFIRDIYVFDSWFHLNKLEQVLGRGIRMCSHALLPSELRNCTIHLLVNTFPEQYDYETMDLYMYRVAMNKAVMMGNITRFLKENALDCNLNKDAIIVKGLPKRRMVDSLGVARKSIVNGTEVELMDINDQNYTSLCDWMECDYECAKPVDVDEITADDSTYDQFTSKYIGTLLRTRLRKLFSAQPYFTYNDFKDRYFSDIPEITLINLLADIVDNRSFHINNGVHEGYITFRNGFYLFQPDRLQDTRIPIAFRVADYPVKRDSYEAALIKAEVSEARAKVAAEDEEESKEEAAAPTEEIDSQQLMKLWIEFVEWGVKFHTEGYSGKIPDKLHSFVQKRYEKNKNKLRRINESLAMFTYVYLSVKSSRELLTHLQKVMLEFVWDELLTPLEQLTIFDEFTGGTGMTSDAAMNSVWKENRMESEGEVVFRFLNPDTAKLEYYKDGVHLKPSLVQYYESKDVDPLAGLRVNTTNTGEIYGTVNVKRGLFVFKTNRPVPPTSAKPEPGSECANVSAFSHHKTVLLEIGNKYAKRDIRSTLGLQEDIISGARPLDGVISACMLTDISLRMLDSMGAGGKRWFYRPISTLKSGHRALLRK